MRLTKPVHLLAATDFDAEPLWGFGLDAESQRGADETWIRAFHLDAVPTASDVLFAAALVTPGTKRPRRGAISFQFVAGRFELLGCALLSPRYCYVDLSPRRAYLQEVLGVDYAAYFPCRYDSSISIAGSAFEAHGEILLARSSLER